MFLKKLLLYNLKNKYNTANICKYLQIFTNIWILMWYCFSSFHIILLWLMMISRKHFLNLNELIYLSKIIKPLGIRVTRLASGIPLGGELEYIDHATLGRALIERKEV